MENDIVRPIGWVGVAVLVAGFGSAAIAEKPSWAGQGSKGHGGPAQGVSPAAPQGGGVVQTTIGPRDRTSIQSYFGQQFAAGNCPPGLAKKNNGCQPPGQAKQWRVGQPLPTTVISYPLPVALLAMLAPPPAGHQYLRVAADVLLIAIGTKLVVDAVADLAGL